MAGTKEGAKSAAATNKAKYGADFYGRIGAIGGKKGAPVAFSPTASWPVSLAPRAVGFQNTVIPPDQRFQAAASYSLMSPPRIGRRRILP
ncbi:hypothetical protein [Pseudonocardia charpentierae]|uniref:Uncharacterized protein n=1 Tax=Pseudonocardia charpentierae TaxID=3075545 RepID=A0ABU2NJB1_9PSEU|nr:hypothetical protein [Pseudonocardia sp. DSM 45834]MDT0353108.1 hypothetical protein [Pseudonocardia sp. DSM 45834]